MHLENYRTAWRRYWAAVVGVASAAAGCTGSDGDDGPPQEPDCLDTAADATCTSLLYTDTSFPSLFSRTLQGACAASNACHSSEGAMGGLVLDDEQTAHDQLLGPGSDGRPRVIPGDTQCGKLIVRLETPDEIWSMPPGSPLSEPTSCVIRHWIADGALRNGASP